jgi:hypothetical protein
MVPRNPKEYEDYLPDGGRVEVGFTEDGAALEDILALYLTDRDMREWEE